MEGKTMTTMMLALTNAISVVRSSPSPTNALLLDDIQVGSFWWLTYAGISCFLVLFAGIMSGLTLGLMSLGLVDLEILQRSGTSQEKKQAAAILPVVKKQHQLLVTLLLCNACALETTPIESTFSLDVNSKLDWEAIGKVFARGHSCVPVYSGNPKNIIGLLLVSESNQNSNSPVRIFNICGAPFQVCDVGRSKAKAHKP